MGLMFLDTAESTSYVTNPNEFMFSSTVENYTTLSKTFGIKYTFFISNYGLGLIMKTTSPIKNNDKYFGQNNYRSLGLFLIKKL